eukprot:g11811.t1 g11811   contig6:628107-629253(+)
MKLHPLAASAITIASMVSPSSAFVVPQRSGYTITTTTRTRHHYRPRSSTPSSAHHQPLFMSDSSPQDDATTDEEGASLASEFFKIMKERNISMEGDEIDFADAEDEEMESEDGDDGELDDDDDAILREYDVPNEANVSDNQIYGEIQDRMFENAGTFVELTRGADDREREEDTAGVYVPPTQIPDSGLTAGEVVKLVLLALRNNDVPTVDNGVEIFFGYSSPGSQIKEQIEYDGMTPSQYRAFLASSDDYLALFEHDEVVIEKAEIIYENLKAYFTVRLINRKDPMKEDVSVNFILSTTGDNDEDCWMIDSMLIRPPKMRRRRRR